MSIGCWFMFSVYINSQVVSKSEYVWLLGFEVLFRKYREIGWEWEIYLAIAGCGCILGIGDDC